MRTGRQTLGTIEEALGRLHGEEGRLDTALTSASERVSQLERERATALRELARIKLDEITAGRLVRGLDAAERRAVAILEEGQHRLAATAERRERLLADVKQVEAERHAAAAAVEAALEAVETLRAEVEAALKKTAPWTAAKSSFDAADAVAAEAEKKALGSETELAAKKKPYDADPLFMYLWSNGFGTQRYSGGNITRMIDRAMADYIGFPDARANYVMLIEIPLRLREHAKARSTVAGDARAALADLERRAMVAAGVEAKERTLAAARHRLAAVDETVEKKRVLLREVDAAHARLIEGGPGGPYEQALETIASSDSTDDITTLYREAQRTQTPADEAIVRRIGKVDEDRAKVDEEITGLRRTAHETARRRAEVEGVRERFRNAGYDHPHGTFGNDGDIARALEEILSGAARSGLLWDLIRAGFRSRMTRGGPGFGSPTFPFPFPIPGGGDGPRGGGWRIPESRGGWSPPIDLPSGGGGSDSSSGNDGFSTGGSF